MWSIFSRDPAKDFAYVIGEKVAGLEEKSVWSIYHGKKKGSGEPVSVFMFDVKGSSESQIALAKSSFKRIKTLRHPNILTFLDGIETEKVIYIATEPVTPLETYIQENESTARQNQLAVSWGLHKVTKGLSFLINDCNLVHNNVCMSSIFVDQAGEWKLGGVDYMYPATGQDSVPPVKIFPYLEKYDPPEKSELRRGIKGETWSSDMWGLGCLIWEVFNGPLTRTSALKAFGKIPKPLVPNYCELVGANPTSRPNPAKFIEDSCRKGGFMNNPLIKTMLFLEEIQIKDPAEKGKFFSNLANALDSFPKQLSRHKVLPQLLHAFEFGNAGSMVLAPLFKVGKLLDQEEYQQKIVPCVVKLFSSTDRTTRVKLLQQIEMFVEHLQPQIVNEKIFPNVVTGFMDTNPVVRESTIKAMLFLAPKLNYKNLNEELMKHFARLQAKDDQGGIRTNTTVCLGKIATYLNPQVRQRILCSAFLRAIKDPFPPSRQAGIIAIAITQNLYTLADVCHKLMPPLCAMTMDPEKTVRDQAFKTLRGFLQKLEQVSENPELQQEMEKEVLSGGTPATGAAGWAGWAIGGVSTLTSKVYSKATLKPTAPTGQNLSGMTVPNTSATTDPAVPLQPSREPETTESRVPRQQGTDEEEDEGWDDGDWGDLDGSPVSPPAPSPPSRVPDPQPEAGVGDGWDDDDDNWPSIDNTPSDNLSSPSSSKHSASTYSSHTNSARNKPSDPPDDLGWGQLPSANSDSDTYKPPKGALKLGGGPGKAPAEDYSWIDTEFAPIEDAGVQPASAYDWGQGLDTGGQDFFSSMGGSSSNTKPQSKSSVRSSVSPPSSKSSSRETTPKPAPSSGTQSSGTQSSRDMQYPGGGDDDAGWGDVGWGEINDTSVESEADRRKREREEKRRQRQTELTQKREARRAGVLRLGARKVAD